MFFQFHRILKSFKCYVHPTIRFVSSMFPRSLRDLDWRELCVIHYS